jgi:RNA polymerase sigma-70 factor (ECF subfamily)
MTGATEQLRPLLIPFISKRVDSQDVDDVVQTVLVRIQRGLASVRDSDKLVPWGYQVARNVIIDHLRGARSRGTSLERADELPAPITEEDESSAAELALVLGQFIAMLPEPYREALQLTEIDGMTQAAAAQRVGLSRPGMKSRVQRGRAQLRELLEACCDIELDTRGSIIEVEPRNRPPHLPDCCSRTLHPSSSSSVSRDMTNTRTSNPSTPITETTEITAEGCCGGPAPAGADACCIKDAAAKAAGEGGCGCGPKVAAGPKRGCC